jgi:hypothetical protein
VLTEPSMCPDGAGPRLAGQPQRQRFQAGRRGLRHARPERTGDPRRDDVGVVRRGDFHLSFLRSMMIVKIVCRTWSGARSSPRNLLLAWGHDHVGRWRTSPEVSFPPVPQGVPAVRTAGAATLSHEQEQVVAVSASECDASAAIAGERVKAAAPALASATPGPIPVRSACCRPASRRLLPAGRPRHARDGRQHPGPVMRLAAVKVRMRYEVAVSWPGRERHHWRALRHTA